MRISIVKISFLGTWLTLILFACGPSTKNQQSSEKGLKDYYKDYFSMGVAVSPRSLKDSQAELIKEQFISITPENVMKMGPIHPAQGQFIWGPGDQIVEFAQENNMKIRGHALCWHKQVPDWLFKNADGTEVSKEELLRRLEHHITNVVSHYKDDIYAWDVVNEAISDKDGEFYRDSKWYQICGEDYIAKAFEYARAADPDLELFYNDYNVINPKKRQKIYELIKSLKEKGVPIDGVGIQGHWSIFEPSEDQLRQTIQQFTDLGVKVQITELDVSIYEKEHSRRDKLPTDKDDFTPELQQQQMDQYEMIFRVFRENKDHLNAVTFWNISDKYSWLDNFPVLDRKDYPLLFDEKLKPKEAYWKVVNFKE